VQGGISVASGLRHQRSPIPSCQDDHVVDELPEESTYWKVPFEWTPPRVLRASGPERSGVTWIAAEDDSMFFDVVAGALADSVDAYDMARVRQLGAREYAQILVTGVPEWGLSHERDWWQLLRLRDQTAGFVLPVIYDDCAKEGLDEGTIFHLGILPAFRGIGLGRELLRQATKTLDNHGVWRIYCDTALKNEPMIHLFEREGWTRLPHHERPVND
jgi:ribosomal protein S18 acetylase RimI-like enzyme